MLVVAIVAAAAAARTVDGSPYRTSRRWIPWELIPIGLGLVSWMRLSQHGGVQLVGDTVRGGDFLAQAFPILSLLAGLCLLVRPLRFVLHRSRRFGARLPVGILMGARRLSSEATTTTVTTVAVGLVAGCIVLSSTISASSEQLVLDKARTYVGSDVAVYALGTGTLPARLAGRATVVHRYTGRNAAGRVEFLGSDPATFGNGVHWLVGAAGSAEGNMLAELAKTGDDAPGTIDGFVVGPLAGGEIEAGARRTIIVDPLRALEWFPGYRNGATLVVVGSAALRATGVPARPEIWVRDPPRDTVEQLAGGGWRIIRTLRQQEIVDATGFRAMRWSYGAFVALGGLGAVVVLVAQLLVLDARRRRRRAAHVLGRPMGVSARREASAVITELAAPLVAGGLIGTAIGIGIITVSMRRLDTLRNLLPPARVVIDSSSIIFTLVGVVAMLAVLGAIGTWSATRVQPMEAMRARD